MYVIAITGGIACGKSTAGAVLCELGATVIDADQIAKNLTEPGGQAAPQIISAFGTLDRKTLASVVFNDPSSRERLNAIVHPLVRQEIDGILHDIQTPIAVVEIPLLYESGMEDIADEVWAVVADKETQLRRLIRRNGLSRDEAMSRVNSQMPVEEKASRANYVIDNSGEKEFPRGQIEALWASACQKAGITND